MCGGLDVALRSASPNDIEFAFGVAQETMREYAIATWGSWAEDKARSGMEKHILDDQMQIIELAGVPIGIEVVERTSDHMRLLQLFIRPAHQRQGIGSGLVRGLIQEAQQKKLPLKLRVLKVNPAQSLYRRVGFKVVSTTAEHIYMEYERPGR
jgi:ribosomal protein S18 acetylase RimI-like enzyme